MRHGSDSGKWKLSLLAAWVSGAYSFDQFGQQIGFLGQREGKAHLQHAAEKEDLEEEGRRTQQRPAHFWPWRRELLKDRVYGLGARLQFRQRQHELGIVKI